MRFLVTGGAGFIGSNFISYILKNYTDDSVVCMDKLTYAGNYDNIAAFCGSKNFLFIQEDICNREAVSRLLKKHPADCIVNFAAESHVDRSLKAPDIFLKTNTIGTSVLLDAANEFGIKRFHQISTDEVYGDLPLDRPELQFDEAWGLKPSSPYSVSKASADLLVLSYYRTFGTPVTISRCSNNYGPYQFPEKLIPLMICKAQDGLPLPVYGDGKNVRDWIHVYDHCRAVDRIIRRGRVGEVYNVGGGNELSNLELVKLLLKLMGKDKSLISFVADRKGHDRRYAICSEKIRQELGWQPKIDFKQGIAETVQWYRENTEWIDRIQSGEYRKAFYNKEYIV